MINLKICSLPIISKFSILKALESENSSNKKGSRNVGIFIIQNKLIKVVLARRAVNQEVLQKIFDKTKDLDNVYAIERSIDLGDNRIAYVLSIAPGISADELTSEQIESIPQQHWDRFEQTIRTLSNRGVPTDLTKRSNFIYDTEKGFQFIDLDLVFSGSTNKFFTKEGIEYYYSFEKYKFTPIKYVSAKDIFLKIGIR